MREFHSRQDLRSGARVEVLAEAVAGDSEDIHAVFPGGERMPHRVRAFLDFMAPTAAGLSGRCVKHAWRASQVGFAPGAARLSMLSKARGCAGAIDNDRHFRPARGGPQAELAKRLVD